MATDLNELLKQSRELKEMLRKLTERADKLQKEIAEARAQNERDTKNTVRKR
jgi:prefoldin subunit 5